MNLQESNFQKQFPVGFQSALAKPGGGTMSHKPSLQYATAAGLPTDDGAVVIKLQRGDEGTPRPIRTLEVKVLAVLSPSMSDESQIALLLELQGLRKQH